MVWGFFPPLVFVKEALTSTNVQSRLYQIIWAGWGIGFIPLRPFGDGIKEKPV